MHYKADIADYQDEIEKLNEQAKYQRVQSNELQRRDQRPQDERLLIDEEPNEKLMNQAVAESGECNQ